MNRIELIGNTTAAPSMTEFNGNEKASFTIAVKRYKDKTDFIPCVAWGTVAKNIGNYVDKGDKLAIVGSLQTRTYDKDGEKRNIFEVAVDEVEFLRATKKENIKEKAEELRKGLEKASDEDLPF